MWSVHALLVMGEAGMFQNLSGGSGPGQGFGG